MFYAKEHLKIFYPISQCDFKICSYNVRLPTATVTYTLKFVSK